MKLKGDQDHFFASVCFPPFEEMTTFVRKKIVFFSDLLFPLRYLSAVHEVWRFHKYDRDTCGDE